MTIFTCAALLIGCFAFVFWPDRNVAAQSAKTRLEYLREHQEVLYDNLRDLNFEYSSGKYPEEDYAAQRATLENEAAETLAEIDVLESGLFGAPGSAPQRI